MEHLQDKIKSFQDCKMKLKNVIKQPGDFQEIALTRHTKCILELGCKLNRWLEVLKYRKYDITYDISQLEKGWISYIKKCKYFDFNPISHWAFWGSPILGGGFPPPSIDIIGS